MFESFDSALESFRSELTSRRELAGAALAPPMRRHIGSAILYGKAALRLRVKGS